MKKTGRMFVREYGLGLLWGEPPSLPRGKTSEHLAAREMGGMKKDAGEAAGLIRTTVRLSLKVVYHSGESESSC